MNNFSILILHTTWQRAWRKLCLSTVVLNQQITNTAINWRISWKIPTRVCTNHMAFIGQTFWNWMTLRKWQDALPSWSARSVLDSWALPAGCYSSSKCPSCWASCGLWEPDSSCFYSTTKNALRFQPAFI